MKTIKVTIKNENKRLKLNKGDRIKVLSNDQNQIIIDINSDINKPDTIQYINSNNKLIKLPVNYIILPNEGVSNRAS